MNAPLNNVLSVSFAVEVRAHEAALEMDERLSRYEGQLRYLNFPAELIRQNCADFVQMSAEEQTEELDR